MVGDGFVVDVNEDRIPVGKDIYQDASKVMDLSKLEAEGPVFGLKAADSTGEKASQGHRRMAPSDPPPEREVAGAPVYRAMASGAPG